MKTVRSHGIAEWDEEDGRDPVSEGSAEARALIRELRESLEGGGPTPVERLIPLIRHRNAEVWGLALELLEYHNDPTAIPAMLEAAADEQIGLAVAAAEVLRYLRNPGADRELIAGLRHDSLPVRLAAISALRERRSTSAVEPLVSLLGDIHVEIRREAVVALASYHRADLLLAVRLAVRALGKVSGPATAYALRMALEDPIWQIVVESLTSLGRISADVDRRILSLLHHEIPEVRAAAAAAVGQSNDPRHIPDLELLLSDSEQAVAKAIRLSIARLRAVASETNSL